MTVSSLKLLVLRTSQLERLRRFYQLLGIDFTEEQHGTGPLHFTGQVGITVIELYPHASEGNFVDSSLRLGFSMTNLDETIQALKKDGIAIVSEPKATAWGARAVVRDPDGRSVELYQD
jgi:predicted enzyme related to lactoylglutathione lyase